MQHLSILNNIKTVELWQITEISTVSNRAHHNSSVKKSCKNNHLDLVMNVQS